MEPAADPTRPADRCADCGHPLAHDQRYCVACGARRAPIPARVAVALDELAGHPAPSAAPADPVAPSSDTGPTGWEILSSARAAAVSILLMLGVGAVIGAATTPGGVSSLARTVVVSFSPASAPPTTIADAGTAPSGGGSAAHTGAGGGHPAGSGGGSGGSAPAAAQTTRTVTLSSPTTTAPATSTASSTTTTGPSSTLPPIHHVWEIVLSGQGFQQSFGTPGADPYLAKTLANQGTEIADYDAVATSPLANEIALVSGQGPTPQTLADCPTYSDIVPGRSGAHAQTLGSGCLYPASTPTLGSELQVQGLTWRAFIQGIGDPGQRHPATTSTTASGTTTSTTTTTTTSSTSTSTTASGSATTPLTDTLTARGCPHPAEGAADTATQVGPGDGYVTWKNPWVYFHAVLDATTCAHEDVGLSALAASLRHERSTPALSYIAADPCDDGSDTPCRAGAPSGLARADAFLKTVVPKIERSPAYRDNGLIVITFDEAPQSGPNWSTASCCGQPTYPNLKGVPAPGTTGSTTTGTTTSSTTAVGTTTPGTTTAGTTTAGTTTPGTTSAGTTTTPCPTTSTTSTTPTTPTTAGTTSTTTATTTPSTTGTTSTPCGPATTGDPPGGGQVGLLLISPYVPARTIDEIHVYNHFSLLKSLATLLGVAPPGYASDADVPALSPTLFTSSKR